MTGARHAGSMVILSVLLGCTMHAHAPATTTAPRPVSGSTPGSPDGSAPEAAAAPGSAATTVEAVPAAAAGAPGDATAPGLSATPGTTAEAGASGMRAAKHGGVVARLPLTIVPAVGEPGPWFAVLLSGDGGWAALDKAIAKELAQHGIPTVGWNSLKYFWSPRTPDGAARDLDHVLRHFSKRWGRKHALLIGFSQGADTMPFMINRLPAASRDLVGSTALLAISDNALFEFHIANWMGNTRGSVPTAPELEHWSSAPYLCLYGEKDPHAACAQLAGAGSTIIKLPGGHRFGGRYTQLADEILSRLPNY